MKRKKISLVSIKTSNLENKMLNKVLNSNWLTMGPLTKKFEKKFAKYIGSKYAVAVNSCTSALQISMAQRNLKADDEIITTPFTWVSTVSAILYAGAKVVFADIDKNSGNISVESIKKVASKKTKGILLVHYAGWPVDIKKIVKLAKKNNWFIIEDCAHGLGSKIDSVHVGRYGLTGCFSFGSTKIMTTGEGGMVVTDDINVYKDLKILRNYGSSEDSFSKYKNKNRDYDVSKLSYNFKINELASAIGIAQLDRVPSFIKERRKTLSLYYQVFKDSTNAEILYKDNYSKGKEISPLFLPLVLNSKLKNKRHLLINKLKEIGIDSTIQYPIIWNLSIYRKLFGNLNGNYPVTEDISSRIISLPCHGDVSKKDILNINNIINIL